MSSLNWRPITCEQPGLGVMLNDISYTCKERQNHESVEADHHYEGLDKYQYSRVYEETRVYPSQDSPPEPDQRQSSSTDDYGYVPVTHGNQQAETSLTQSTTASSTEVAVVAAGESKGQGKSGVNEEKMLYANCASD